jgi:predicted metal-dependent phosphoesterase TrpH/PAS domain-containing protein
MPKIKIELHCHSNHSDGVLTPEQLAQKLAENDVSCAALTDHDTLSGQEAFEAACERYGIGCIPGLELTSRFQNYECHLLCYNFNRNNNPLQRMVTAVKEAHRPDANVYTVSARHDFNSIIQIIHGAGGLVFLAHPLLLTKDTKRLAALLENMKQHGLDGIEADHPSASDSEKKELFDIAQKLALLTSFGSDFHGTIHSLPQQPGVELEKSSWDRLRDTMLEFSRKSRASLNTEKLPAQLPSEKPRIKIKIFFPLVLPAAAAVILFAFTLFGIFLPDYEKSLMDKKKEMIREITHTLWTLLDATEKSVLNGELKRSEAQKHVIAQIRSMRYGREEKDYFWIQDTVPNMIMHPFRSELEGQNLSDFKDANGEKIFVIFSESVTGTGEAYVDYAWQWNDQPGRVEAKESYIRLFEPWGWIIGTGLYIHDVEEEIIRLEMHILYIMIFIIILILLLLLVIIHGGLKSEKMRVRAEKKLHESNLRYASLVKAAAEGILFTRKGHCVYANPVFLEFADCEASELSLLDLSDFFPKLNLAFFLSLADQPESYTETELKRRNGESIECSIGIKHVQNDRENLVILVRRSEKAFSSAENKNDALLKRLLNLPAAAAEDIADNIAAASNPEEVIKLCWKVPSLVQSALETGANSLSIAEIITSVSDSATSRFIELEMKKLGPAPAPFAFLTLGSQGRREQTLFTDQDNAIIYADTDKAVESSAYFSLLGRAVCANLIKSGYKKCSGLIMADNPKWCQPAEVWKNYFTDWIRKTGNHDMMEFNIFYDLRHVYGEEYFDDMIKRHVLNEIKNVPWFFPQAAENALAFKTPVRLFGNIIAGRNRDKSGKIDLKAVMMPIVSFARLYALKNGLTPSGTKDRLAAFRDIGGILPSRYHNIVTAFEVLMRLRLRHQSDTIRRGIEADNLIEPSWLGHIDGAILKECFNEIDSLQERIQRDFNGGI